MGRRTKRNGGRVAPAALRSSSKVRQGLRLGHGPAGPGPTVDTTIAALELAAAGAGVALAHRMFLGPYFSTGRLVKAAAQEFPDDNSYFVITPERPQRVRQEVQRFRDWLIAVAAEEST